MQQKMAPLLSAYGVANVDPITGSITIGLGLDRMFDDVVTIQRMTVGRSTWL
jgi:hypothetical protein